jgi:hypothetical protein
MISFHVVSVHVHYVVMECKHAFTLFDASTEHQQTRCICYKVEVMLLSKISIVTLVVALSAICLLSVDARTFVGSSSVSFLPSQQRASLLVRGGASAVVEDEEDVSEIESSDYDEGVEDNLVKSAQSTIAKKAKKAVASSLAATKPKKKKSSLMKLLRIPYIFGACLNPIVMAQMIKGYWVSLFNLNYLQENTVSNKLMSNLTIVGLESFLIRFLSFSNEGSIRKPPKCFARKIKERRRH